MEGSEAEVAVLFVPNPLHIALLRQASQFAVHPPGPLCLEEHTHARTHTSMHACVHTRAH